MPFRATWMDLEIVILTEVSQRKTKAGYHLYVESLKSSTNRPIHKTDLQIQKKKKKKEIKKKKKMYHCQRGKLVHGGVNQGLGINMHTLLYIK